MSRNPNLQKLNEERLAAMKDGNGWGFRRLHIAWCLLRGRTIDQIESASSNPHTFPSLDDILWNVQEGYRPKAEGQDDEAHAAERSAYLKSIREQLTAWKKKLHLAWLEAEPKKRARNAAKRAQPRVHRPRPETLPERRKAVL